MQVNSFRSALTPYEIMLFHVKHIMFVYNGKHFFKLSLSIILFR